MRESQNARDKNFGLEKCVNDVKRVMGQVKAQMAEMGSS